MPNGLSRERVMELRALTEKAIHDEGLLSDAALILVLEQQRLCDLALLSFEKPRVPASAVLGYGVMTTHGSLPLVERVHPEGTGEGCDTILLRAAALTIEQETDEDGPKRRGRREGNQH